MSSDFQNRSKKSFDGGIVLDFGGIIKEPPDMNGYLRVLLCLHKFPMEAPKYSDPSNASTSMLARESTAKPFRFTYDQVNRLSLIGGPFVLVGATWLVWA
jgi:hypothetical protein